MDSYSNRGLQHSEFTEQEDSPQISEWPPHGNGANGRSSSLFMAKSDHSFKARVSKKRDNGEPSNAKTDDCNGNGLQAGPCGELSIVQRNEKVRIAGMQACVALAAGILVAAYILKVKLMEALRYASHS